VLRFLVKLLYPLQELRDRIELTEHRMYVQVLRSESLESIAIFAAKVHGQKLRDSYVDVRVPVGTEPNQKSGWLPASDVLLGAHWIDVCSLGFGEPVGTAMAQAQVGATGLPAFGD
jgi:hypothetical protein